MTDEQHAYTIREAVTALEAAIGHAVADGLDVSLSVATKAGMKSGRDHTTSFPIAVASVARPL